MPDSQLPDGQMAGTEVRLVSVSAWVYHIRPMRTITLTVVFTASALAQWLNLSTPGIPRTADGKPNLTAPVPRMPDGKPDLSGLWQPELTPYRFDVIQDVKNEGIFRPAAQALFFERAMNLRHDNPVTHCLPAGPQAIFAAGSTRFYRIVQSPNVVALLYELGDFRQIYTDGRELPKDPNPTWMGYSIGHWEGDTLVVESEGFNDRSWLDIEGHPHTEALRITERFRRRDFGHMDLEIIIDDPKAFMRPFSLKIAKTLVPDTDLLESICENDTSIPHMLGGVEITKLAPEILAQYVGVYEYGAEREARITLSGDLLFLQEGGNPLKLPLAANTETDFVERTQGERLDFIRDSQGMVTGFTFHARVGDRTAVRKR